MEAAVNLNDIAVVVDLLGVLVLRPYVHQTFFRYFVKTISLILVMMNYACMSLDL